MMLDLLRELRMRFPIIQAPMGGGPGTPELAAAVSNSGGLGSLAGGYLSPDQIADDIAKMRRLTSGSVNINLFAGGYHRDVDRVPAPILELMGRVHRELQLPEPVLPTVPPDPFLDQVRVVIETRPEVFSFTFGIPPADVMRELRTAGIATFGTATTLTEAEMLADINVDAIVAQGAEAGAHRGTFAVPYADALIPTIQLVKQIAAKIRKPVIASGGIMTGAEIGTALRAGATAVQLGTVFLACPEAGTSLPYREALLRAKDVDTVITRAYSGRAARGIRNMFIDLVAERDDFILPFPIQNTLTRPMRTAAARAGRSEYLSLWAGTGVAQIRELPAGAMIAALMNELIETMPDYETSIATA